ncbi:hypothetical protein SHI21_05885 [Bacteriovorax sp. PP10]|uniref:Uncharacterized protein n=1 Tax=Bacteriovorax antarcticus TaxID=3088717 RepID=A0ABU5VTK1_9BACT|nr:hypothetical protein [Bacteriovorax sp. PP10]MEA9355718.1 hypothetical protein [Bacteriovorax sp. PP10]
MKKLLLILGLVVSFPSFALNAKLEPAVKMVEACLASQGVLLCNPEITEVLKTVSLDARGEFVYYLKDVLNKNETEKTIVNLYTELQVLAPIYEKLDGCSEWSCRDLKIFLGDVSIRYVKVSPINSELYIKLYKGQAVQSGRYGLLATLSEKSDKAANVEEMDEMIRFAEFAKNWSRQIGDEYYLYQAGVAIVRKMTLAAMKVRPGHEGVYSIVFDNAEVNKDLKIDSVVVMESNDRDALVVNFVASSSRVIQVAFKQAGLLGNTFFSNEEIYNNENNPQIQSPYFKMELDRETKTVKGVFTSARYGKSTFSGKLVKSNLSVYSQDNVEGVTLEQLIGKHSVQVGNYSMTLSIGKRADDRTVYEAALVSDNALITFSKVSIDSAKGIVSLVDSNNQRKLTLGVTDISASPVFVGQFLNAPQAKILEVVSK